MKYKVSALRYLILFFFILSVMLLGSWKLSQPALAPVLNSPITQKLHTTGLTLQGNEASAVAPVSGNLTPIDDSEVQAESYLIYDASTGSTLAQKLPQSPIAIASLTKLMTGYLVTKYGSMDDVITITSGDQVSVSPALNLQVGEKVRVQNLFSAMMVGSTNDAAQTLGAYIASKRNTTISDAMNSEAQLLSMHDTHFSNPLGFDSDTNYSTAENLEIIVKATRAYPIFNDLSRFSSYSFTSVSGQVHNTKATNKLIAADPQIRGVKTGFTDEALGAMITEITVPKGSFYIIVLHSPNREADTLLLKQKITASFY